MPIVKTKLDDATYSTLVSMRKKAGVPSVSALFLQKCGLLTDQMEADEIVKGALKSAKQKPSGTKFRLRDLYTNQQWMKFSIGARIRAGQMFNDEIGSVVHGIRTAGKSSSNHQLYIVA